MSTPRALECYYFKIILNWWHSPFKRGLFRWTTTLFTDYLFTMLPCFQNLAKHDSSIFSFLRHGAVTSYLTDVNFQTVAFVSFITKLSYLLVVVVAPKTPPYTPCFRWFRWFYAENRNTNFLFQLRNRKCESKWYWNIGIHRIAYLKTEDLRIFVA
jgi:hypothetical protein